jgi:hypothetical protein
MPVTADRILRARAIPLEAKFVGGAKASDGHGGECGILAIQPWRMRGRATQARRPR